MVEYQASAPSQLDGIFHALGDATRRRMLQALAGGERTVGQLAEPFAMSLAAASKHVRTLEQAGLVQREVRGRTHLCRLDPAPLADAHHWLAAYERFWTRRLDVLEQLLRQADGSASGPPAVTPSLAPPAAPARPDPTLRTPRNKGPRR